MWPKKNRPDQPSDVPSFLHHLSPEKSINFIFFKKIIYLSIFKKK